MPSSITIVAVGRKNGVLDEEVDRYVKLLRPFAHISITLIKPLQLPENQHAERIERESAALQAKWPPKDRGAPVALSEEGRLRTSREFSEWLDVRLRRDKSIAFIIGGAYGLSAQLKKRCAEIISLSPMTLPHKLCVVVLIEQIYRAFTILHNHPYHK
jgi:23S rRNA (pseudouridine1915-N3)-methyltransferase